MIDRMRDDGGAGAGAGAGAGGCDSSSRGGERNGGRRGGRDRSGGERSGGERNGDRDCGMRGNSPLARALRRAAAWSSAVIVGGFAIAAVVLTLTFHAQAAALISLAIAGVLALFVCEATPLIAARSASRGARGADLSRRMVAWWGVKIVLVMVGVWAVIAFMPAGVLDRWVFGVALAAGVVVGDNVNVLALHSARIPVLDDFNPGDSARTSGPAQV
ncbi:hypothetical protein [Pseudoscardovia suis]|uniref:Uncharacterized protein n=1 Tax=Pseudoscardovia suis TaxID=987063 RepID=A0A261EQJ1_9BIFI|nr:hypothetical protein [Pseudoscardovia suis]OZG49128.1 hypothetical protein PSSU_1623 [Pseudoscardovia suis]PJJ65995.1 hypothetical protein CLV65_1247 [Pseudoscardovia suis]